MSYGKMAKLKIVNQITAKLKVVSRTTAKPKMLIRKPVIIKGSRRRRISCGSGVNIQEINRFLKEFAKISKGLKNINRQMSKNVKGKKRKSRREVSAFGLEKLEKMFQ